jgi:hypothetical protein
VPDFGVATIQPIMFVPVLYVFGGAIDSDGDYKEYIGIFVQIAFTTVATSIGRRGSEEGLIDLQELPMAFCLPVRPDLPTPRATFWC